MRRGGLFDLRRFIKVATSDAVIVVVSDLWVVLQAGQDQPVVGLHAPMYDGDDDDDESKSII